MASVIECTNEQYHARSEVGASMLKTILYSPEDYRDFYVAHTRKFEQTKSMLLGSLVHCLILEPKNYESIYAVEPAVDGRTTDGKKIKAEFALKSLGKQIVDAKMDKKARAIANRALSEPMVQEFIEGAIIERAVVSVDEKTGIEIKCKADIFRERPDLDSDVHIDIKTAQKPKPYQRGDGTWAWKPMTDLRYDLSVAAHYPQIISDLTGRPCSAGVISIGIKEPYPVFYLDVTSYWQCGEAWRRLALDRLAQCRETGLWRDPLQDSVVHATPSQYDFPGDGGSCPQTEEEPQEEYDY